MASACCHAFTFSDRRSFEWSFCLVAASEASVAPTASEASSPSHERTEGPPPLYRCASEASAPTTASEASAASHEQSERPLFTSEASALTAVLAAEGHRRASEGGGPRPQTFDCHSSRGGPLTTVTSLAAQQKRESSPRPQPVLFWPNKSMAEKPLLARCWCAVLVGRELQVTKGAGAIFCLLYTSDAADD